MGARNITANPIKYGLIRSLKETSMSSPFKIVCHFKVLIAAINRVKPKMMTPFHPENTKKALLISCQPTLLPIQIKIPTPIKREIKKSNIFFIVGFIISNYIPNNKIYLGYSVFTP
jgi:hypothetical protein